MTSQLAFEMPTGATVLSVAVAAVLLYKGILENLIASYSGLAGVRKEQLDEAKKKLSTVEEAYALALVEIDTSRRIRGEHNARIRSLELELATARGLSPPQGVHSTEN